MIAAIEEETAQKTDDTQDVGSLSLIFRIMCSGLRQSATSHFYTAFSTDP